MGSTVGTRYLYRTKNVLQHLEEHVLWYKFDRAGTSKLDVGCRFQLPTHYFECSLNFHTHDDSAEEERVAAASKKLPTIWSVGQYCNSNSLEVKN
jgi:hypothetical protein